MIIQLFSEKLKVEIDTLGAYVKEFKYNDKDIFFPKKLIEQNGQHKQRGGNHVCYPYFGMSEKIGIERHGFGRVLEWDVLEKSENHVKLYLKPNIEYWEKLVATIEYKLEENVFETILEVKNEGEESFEISPAFHPYFACKNLNTLKINGENLKYDQSNLPYSINIGKVSSISFDDVNLGIITNNLEKNVLWTDFLDHYICIEPTFNWNALETGKELFEVKAGNTAKFTYSIKILA